MNDLLVDEAFDAVFGHAGVPESFGVNHEDWASLADSQAVDFGSVACVGPGGEGKILFLEKGFEFRPRCTTLFG